MNEGAIDVWAGSDGVRVSPEQKIFAPLPTPPNGDAALFGFVRDLLARLAPA